MQKERIYSDYLNQMAEKKKTNDAREESFYSTLEAFLLSAGKQLGRSVQITTLPKKTDAGNPDFRIWDEAGRIIGYIEAKRPEEENLGKIEKTEQLDRYRKTFPNLILTNFLEFRLYREGELVESVSLASPWEFARLGHSSFSGVSEDFTRLLQRFLDFSIPQVPSAEKLAFELARRTCFLKEMVLQQMHEEANQPDTLTGFYQAFHQYLISDLTPESFADLYAQTITYGLFAARYRSADGFTRKIAYERIPHSIGVLRDVFRFISSDDAPPQIEWIVDEIAQVLSAADTKSILSDFYHQGKGNDPIVHFYETFLAQYDPQTREQRGVYYTPDPVVSYIVGSLHQLMKTEFEKPDGLASDGVTLLDPAAGTMTFIAKASQLAVEEQSKYGLGSRKSFIQNHVLKHFYSFELMMAPYVVGHLKMSFILEELGHRLEDDERFPFYLTNTLDHEELDESLLPGFRALSRESHIASQIKNQSPVLVILGNPPYYVHSKNTGAWITELVNMYKYIESVPLGEKNSKVLQDDYVKFLRFAQWKIDQAGQGVVGMITNHGFLSNPTFRGMRYHLLKSFDQIYILNLHGNSLSKETSPDGSKDENVFDIRPGVAISFLIKHPKTEANTQPSLFYADCWGLRSEKYQWLDSHSIETTRWTQLQPQPDFYLFVPQDQEHQKQYAQYIPVPEIFPVNSTGIKTHRDHFVVDMNREDLIRRMEQFCNPSLDDQWIRDVYKLPDTGSWNLSECRKKIQKVYDWRESIVPYAYRAFDQRWLCFREEMLDRPRMEVMQHMMDGTNLALVTCRQLSTQGWQHILVSKTGADTTFMSNKTKEANYFFPLYLLPIQKKGTLFDDLDSSERKPNIHPKVFDSLAQQYGKPPSPEGIFSYVYAVFHAPVYREKYAPFLQMDFPRVPFTKDSTLFDKLASLGNRLIQLHLLNPMALGETVCRFEGEGDAVVEKGQKTGVRFDPEHQRVYINKDQYFHPIPQEIWNHHVGGYQVCQKWLKDRKERRLEWREIQTYCQIVTSFHHTLNLQKEVNRLFSQIEESTISF